MAKEDVRDLPCKLTEDERVLIQVEHVRTCDVMAETEDSKKKATAEWKKKIDELKSTERKQRKAAISGVIDRPVKCIEHIDADARTVQWFRTDTGEAVGELRAASPDEVKRAKHELYLRQQGGLFKTDPEAPENPPNKPKPEEKKD